MAITGGEGSEESEGEIVRSEERKTLDYTECFLIIFIKLVR